MVLGKFHNALLTTEIGVWKCHAEISDFYLLLIFQIHTLGKAYTFPNSPLIIISIMRLTRKPSLLTNNVTLKFWGTATSGQPMDKTIKSQKDTAHIP